MAIDLSMSVLMVDDYTTMIRNIKNLLRQIGFEDVDDASDGSTALEKMRGKQYGLMISDWNMEPMTGYDLMEVRTDDGLSKTPFIMITAESKLAHQPARADQCRDSDRPRGLDPTFAAKHQSRPDDARGRRQSDGRGAGGYSRANSRRRL